METMMVGGGFGGLFWLIILGLVIWMAVDRKPSSIPPYSGERNAQDILDAQYASGQIDRETYLQMKQDLSS